MAFWFTLVFSRFVITNMKILTTLNKRMDFSIFQTFLFCESFINSVNIFKISEYYFYILKQPKHLLNLRNTLKKIKTKKDKWQMKMIKVKIKKGIEERIKEKT